MNRHSKAASVLFLLVLGAAASESAMAQHHGGVRFGINIGIPLFGAGYYPPYAYPAPAYAYPAPAYAYPAPAYGYPAPAYSYPAPAYSYPAPAYSYPAPAVAPPAAYAGQGIPQAAPAPGRQQDWQYCAESNAYYPYVRECPGGWQRVPAQPPR
jgi:hypothetical protein